jgi:UTP-glucose-1-phosphate uridylyltransferase
VTDTLRVQSKRGKVIAVKINSEVLDCGHPVGMKAANDFYFDRN